MIRKMIRKMGRLARNDKKLDHLTEGVYLAAFFGYLVMMGLGILFQSWWFVLGSFVSLFLGIASAIIMVETVCPR